MPPCSPRQEMPKSRAYCGPDPTLPPKHNRPSACADCSFFDWSDLCVLDRRKNVLRRNMPPTNGSQTLLSFRQGSRKTELLALFNPGCTPTARHR